MKYIIMCGGIYSHWKIPRQLTQINEKERLVERTIRLLKENGVKEIYISSTDMRFADCGVPVLVHNNKFNCGTKDWIDAFYLTDEPVCYLFGDVVFSEKAISEIVETQTESVEFFASSPPFSKIYIKKWAEPFAFKVQDTKLFNDSIAKFKELEYANKFNRQPAISWELWQIIKGTPINVIDYTNYHVINDFTCDIDCEDDIRKFKRLGVIK